MLSTTALIVADANPDLVAFLAGPVGAALLRLVPPATVQRAPDKSRQATAERSRQTKELPKNDTWPKSAVLAQYREPAWSAPLKVCTKCGHALPATLEQFGPHGSTSDGLRSVCRPCRRTRSVGLRREPRTTVPRQPRPTTPAIQQWCARYAAEHHCGADQARDVLTRWPAGCALVHELKRLRRSPYSLPAARAFVRAYRQENPFSGVRTALAAYCHIEEPTRRIP